MSTQPIALKEWASAVKALEDGTQIIIMRKGGIAEETRDFQVETGSFYLYPTYEHQKQSLLKQSCQSLIDATLEGWSIDDPFVNITAYARLVEDIEILDQEKLDRLLPFHIWTESFTEERLKWKRKNPLHVMLLRVYKLEEPVRAEISSAYLGCKSWIQLQGEWGNVSMSPVLDDADFEAQAAALRAALG